MIHRLFLVCALAMASLTIGCGDDGEGGYNCTEPQECGPSGVPAHLSFVTCCKGTGCEYRIDGQVFECESTENCDEAAQATVDYCLTH